MRAIVSLCLLSVVVSMSGCGRGASSVMAPEDVASDPAFAAAVAEAKANFGEFVTAWRAKKRSHKFQVKKGFESEIGGTVYVWIRVIELKGGKIRGELIESPEFSIGKIEGDKDTVDQDDVVDWLYYDMEGNVTGDYTTEAHTNYLRKKRG